MRILVTGATGFIGAAVARLAVERGHTVAAIARNPPHDSEPSNITWLRGSLADPPWDLIAAFEPETCLHAAWIATPRVYLQSPLNADYAHWTVALGEGLRERGLRHFVGLGTCIEYQLARQRLREDETPLAPASPYAQAKNATRSGLADVFAASATKFSWARIFYPYGPGEHPARLCSSLIRQLRAGETMRLQRPENTNDYIFIDDVAAALLAIIDARLEGAVNVGTGDGVTVASIARTIRALLQERGEAAGEIEEAQNAPADYIVADAARLRGTGWSPRFTQTDGIAAMLNGVPQDALSASF